MWSYIDTEFIIVIDVLMAYNMYCVIIETKPFCLYLYKPFKNMSLHTTII